MAERDYVTPLVPYCAIRSILPSRKTGMPDSRHRQQQCAVSSLCDKACEVSSVLHEAG